MTHTSSRKLTFKITTQRRPGHSSENHVCTEYCSYINVWRVGWPLTQNRPRMAPGVSHESIVVREKSNKLCVIEATTNMGSFIFMEFSIPWTIVNQKYLYTDIYINECLFHFEKSPRIIFFKSNNQFLQDKNFLSHWRITTGNYTICVKVSKVIQFSNVQATEHWHYSIYLGILNTICLWVY